MSITINQSKVTYGPSIATDMIFYLDAGNTKSYPGTGNIWYDLTENGHDAYGDPGTGGAGSNDSNFPTWQSNNGGRFYFDGTDGLTILTDLGAHTEISADFWTYKSGVGTSQYWFDARNDGGQWWLTNYTSHNIIINSALIADDPSTYQANSNWWDKWIHVVITSNAGGSALWINGENINDSRLKLSNSIDENLGQYFRIGNRYTSSGRYVGYFSIIRFYDRVLTNAEIVRHYNAQKNRFGY